MKWMTVSLLACTLLFGATGVIAQAPRVGTFDRQAIVVAFYGSPQWAEVLREKQIELKAAQQANDQKKVDELNKWGGESQELAQRQLAGHAPIDNILKAMAPAIQDICKAENLSKVIPASASDPASQTVDVTLELLDWLKASEKTRGIIRQMQQK
jgi:hypothetical protein